MTERKPPTPEALARYAEGFNRSATLRFFGVTISFPDTRLVRAELKIRPDHRGGMGTSAVNGGIRAAMFDLVVGCTGALVDPTRKSATLQLSMSFERALAGDLLVAEAHLDRVGGRTAFASAWIKDERGEICARCQGVVRLSNEPWESGHSPAVN